ncbi:ribose-phosphate diphosphokinase [Methanocella sp. CWC-04]|uniref:Ribose-phosphate pyrophosphokinase n=1 Tax=Methanooceanicella nereidis TaxID=2052831 RepID=A0AAP2W606_9EURY|nr:ribose-phosphate diphosphokinase [Methanocella sp. CWC-04]MCD1293804.1 ribose-phosphate diphosphokinase [Methanocella sp. CWC-04]
MSTRIVAGPSSQLLATRVASLLDCEFDLTDYKEFPDGEVYCRVTGDVKGEDIVIIQSTPHSSDLIYLLQLIDACDEAKSVTVVVPYFGYARQDKRFKEGEPISARAMAKTIDADRVFTVNIHDRSVLKHFPCEATDLNAAPEIGNYIDTMGLLDPVILAPDDGALNLVRSASEPRGLHYDYLEKTRLSGEEVKIAPKNLDINGRDVVLLDDIISTGGTIAEAIKLLKTNGVRDVYVGCVHPVLVRNAVLKLYNAGVKSVISTDTLEKATSVISVAPVIAEALKK